MPTTARQATEFIQRHLLANNVESLAARLRPKETPRPSRVPGGARLTADALDKRWKLLNVPPEARVNLADADTVARMECYQRNIENFIGTVKVPVGLAGPLRVNGLFAQGDFYLPLATTEAALVASYSRGAQVISEAGGCAAMLVNEGVSRAPAFAFRNLEETGRFLVWALSQQERFREAAEATTRHGRLTDVRFAVEGNHVYLTFEFSTASSPDRRWRRKSTPRSRACCRTAGLWQYARRRATKTARNIPLPASLRAISSCRATEWRRRLSPFGAPVSASASWRTAGSTACPSCRAPRPCWCNG